MSSIGFVGMLLTKICTSSVTPGGTPASHIPKSDQLRPDPLKLWEESESTQEAKVLSDRSCQMLTRELQKSMADSETEQLVS